MSIWNKFPNLSDSELRTLVATTSRVILDSEEARSDLPPDLLEISPGSASRTLASLLPGIPAEKASEIQDLLQDGDSSRKMSLAVLEEVQKHPELAQRVATAYAERTQKMVVPELMLLTGALVILAIKIEKIHWGKDGGTITFRESAEAVKTFLSGLLAGIKG